MTIAEALRRVKSVNLRSEVPAIILRQKADVILLNQLQLLHGMDSDSAKLAPYKNPYYAKKKLARNPLSNGSADLRDTGEFYQDFTLTIKGRNFSISSTNFKTSKLLKQYGKNIFGLSDQSKATYSADNLRPAIQAYITKQTGFKFT